MDILGLGLIEINDCFLFLIIIITSVYLYLTWDFQYFEMRGIPGPKPVPLLGTIYPVLKQGFHAVDVARGKKYGNVYGIFEGPTPLLMVSDQEMIKTIFVKEHASFMDRRKFSGGKTRMNMLAFTSGDNWKVLRSTISPTFSTGKLRQMTQQMNECAENLVENLAKEAESGNHLECKEYAGAFTMDAIAYTSFGLKLDSQKDKSHEFVQTAKKGLHVAGGVSFLHLLLLFFPFLMRLLNYLQIDFAPKEVVEFFGEVTNQTFERRKELNEKRTDLLQLMINAHKEVKTTDTEHDQDFHDQHGDTEKRGLTKDEIIAQGILFFLVGYHANAMTISYCMYLLALNPDIQEKLFEEIVNMAGNKEIDYDALSRMTLLDMCVQETLRMYPPLTRTNRACTTDTVVKGMKIQKGQVVIVPIYAIHHDPQIWPDPEKFDPYRFSKEEKTKHNSFDWIPFGAGPRNCVAMRLALTEVKMGIAHIVRNYKLLRGSKTQVPLKLKVDRLLTPENGIWVQIEKR